MIYFISDLHFGHSNIINFERKQFKNIEEHDKYIINKYNEIVKKDDTAYILGDLGAAGYGCGREYLIDCFKQLRGNKIIVMGNHDGYSVNFYKTLNGVIDVFNHPLYLTKRIVLSHIPVKVNDDVINVHGHLHGAILSLDNYVCVSAHMINYKPLPLKRIMNKLYNIPKESIKFGEEWYADFYTEKKM